MTEYKGVVMEVRAPCAACASRAVDAFVAYLPVEHYWMQCRACGLRGPEIAVGDRTRQQALVLAMQAWDSVTRVSSVTVKP